MVSNSQSHQRKTLSYCVLWPAIPQTSRDSTGLWCLFRLVAEPYPLHNTQKAPELYGRNNKKWIDFSEYGWILQRLKMEFSSVQLLSPTDLLGHINVSANILTCIYTLYVWMEEEKEDVEIVSLRLAYHFSHGRWSENIPLRASYKDYQPGCFSWRNIWNLCVGLVVYVIDLLSNLTCLLRLCWRSMEHDVKWDSNYRL